MRSQRTVFWTAVIALAGLALGAAAAQETKRPAPGAAKEQAMPAAPKPGPEQAILKRDEGV